MPGCDQQGNFTLSHPTRVILSISQQDRTSQLSVCKMVRPSVRLDCILEVAPKGLNEECTRYSWYSGRCRCLGINTARGLHEIHTTFHMQCSWCSCRTKMSNELSFTRMTHTLSLYVCTRLQRCWQICRNWGSRRTSQLSIYQSMILRLHLVPQAAAHCRSST